MIFVYKISDLKDLSDFSLKYAKSLGATEVKFSASESVGLSVGVRCGEIETIEHNHDKEIGVSVYIGQRSGSASTSDFSYSAIQSTIKAAFEIAQYTAEDPCSGFAPLELLATDPLDLQLFHPWDDLNVELATRLAIEMESAMFDTDPRIVNSEGAVVYTQESISLLSSSQGYSFGDKQSYHGMGCSPIAMYNNELERDSWYIGARLADDLANPSVVGRYAAERALSRLNPQSIETGNYPVLFDAPLAIGLVQAWVAAVSGMSQYRGNTFLKNCLGTQVFPSDIQIIEQPHQLKGYASRWFDQDGVRTQNRSVVVDGIVQGYFLSQYSANKLGMKTTGHAGGIHNLFFQSHLTTPDMNLKGMLKKLERGVFITEIMGSGINRVNGDYSQGASGYWVENGHIQFPIAGFTIAGNLLDMYKSIVAVGNDVYTQGAYSCGSILLENMMIATQ